MAAFWGKRALALRDWSRDRNPFGTPDDRKPIHSIDPTQRRILDYITSHPGVYLREICRELGIAMGGVQYHLRRLERDGRITSARRGLHRFFYPANLFGERQREVLSILGLNTPRDLLLNILQKPESTQAELASAAHVSAPTASWHLKRLADLGIVGRTQEGRTVTYKVAGGEEIAKLIKTYHPTVWESWSSRLADIFIAYSEEGV